MGYFTLLVLTRHIKRIGGVILRAMGSSQESMQNFLGSYRDVDGNFHSRMLIKILSSMLMEILKNVVCIIL